MGHANAGGDHPDPNKMGQKVTATLARDGTIGNDPSKAGPGTDFAYYDDVPSTTCPRLCGTSSTLKAR